MRRSVDHLIRSKSISDIINRFVPDPPGNAKEYRVAQSSIWERIEECQPNWRKFSLAKEEALAIKDHEVNPYRQLAYWISGSVLSLALDEYPRAFECAIIAQETACKYKNNDLLVAGAMYTFGVSIFALRQKKWFLSDGLSPLVAANYCFSLIMKDPDCIRSHSEDKRILAASYHQLAYLLWDAQFLPDGSPRNIIYDPMIDRIEQFALDIDHYTDYELQLLNWVRAIYKFELRS